MMKIYTKKGDKGQTSLIGGTRLAKSHDRIDAYGTVDELNSYIGLLRDSIKDAKIRALLKYIQDRLFTIGASLASDPEKSRMHIPDLTEEDVKMLEESIDEMSIGLSELKNFILPGGHTFVSFCHIARCVCRRAERLAVKVAESEFVDELVIKYLNRLSDHLFVLARKLSKDLNVEEVEWKPRG